MKNNSIELKSWKFKYIDGSCSLGKPENGSTLSVPAEGSITGVGVYDPACNRGYDDSAWQTVTVPHDWAVSMPFDKSCSSGTGYLAGGIAWYRSHIDLTEEQASKSGFLCFDGVYKHAQVWCNSYYLGNWANGYTPFSFDVTGLLHPGHNEIAVKVSHPDIADSRWYTGSGMTRGARLELKESLHFVKDGLAFDTPIVSEKEAVISITSEISALCSDSITSGEVRVSYELISPDGNNVFSQDSSASADSAVSVQGILESPLLWSPENPVLYTLRASLFSSEGLQDRIEYKVGIRSFVFDADKGFFINGKSCKLKGVCLHEDAGCFGNAVPAAVWERRLAKLKECGCNAIRMSHNPHEPELYDLCDSMGFFVIDEAFDEWEGVKNKWSTGHNVYPPVHQGYFEDFHQWYDKDIASFVRRDRNHPSIILWSIGNEIDYPNDPYCHPLFESMTGNNDKNKPAAEKLYNPNRPNTERLTVLAKKITAQVKKHDETRPVTLASAFPELTSRTGLFDAVDVIGYNYKEHLYHEDHKRFPSLPIMGSENGHNYSQWKAVRDNDFISSQFLWTGIDYLGEAYGWPIHGSAAGLMTLAGFDKAEFWFRKSLWNDEPMVRIFTALDSGDKTKHVQENQPRWNGEFSPLWNYNPGEKVEVRVFTNQKEVELSVNGKSAGIFARSEETGFVTAFIPFEAGTLSAEAGNGNLRDTLVTTGCGCALKAEVYETAGDSAKNQALSTVTATEKIVQVEVVCVDSAGNPVCTDDRPVTAAVSGAKLLGIENGDLADNTAYSENYRRLYCGRQIVFVACSSENNGEATLTLTASGCAPVTVSL